MNTSRHWVQIQTSSQHHVKLAENSESIRHLAKSGPEMEAKCTSIYKSYNVPQGFCLPEPGEKREIGSVNAVTFVCVYVLVSLGVGDLFTSSPLL